MKTLKQLRTWRTAGAVMLLAAGSHNVMSQNRSLDECVRLALKNNEEIRNGELQIQASEFQISELKASLLPRLDGFGQYQYYTDVPSQYAPASSFGGSEGEYSKLMLGLPQTTSAGLQSSVNLFNQSVFAGVRGAKLMKEASQWQAALTQDDVVYRVVSTYFTVQVLQDNLTRLRENITNLEKTVAIEEVLKANELVSENVHNRLLINLENLRNQYNYEQLTRDKQLSALKYLVRLNESDSLSVEPFDYTAPVMLDEISQSRRPDLALQEARIRIAEADRKIVVAGYYPTLTGAMNYSMTGYNGDFSPGTQINSDWIRSSSFALSLKIPVFDGFQRHYKVKQKDIEINRYRNTLTMMEAKADQERADARDSYNTNANQLLISRRTLQLAESLFAAAQNEFESGITSTTDLLNAQNDLTSARTNYSNALLNIKLAELEWKKSNGVLIQDYTTPEN